MPAEQLARLADRSDEVDGGIGPAEVAEHFEVPVPVARRALELAVRPDG